MYLVTNHANNNLSIDGPGIHYNLSLENLKSLRMTKSGSFRHQYFLQFDLYGNETFSIYHEGSEDTLVDLMEEINRHWFEYKKFYGVFENSGMNPVVVPANKGNIIIHWGSSTVKVNVFNIIGLTRFPNSLQVYLKDSQKPIIFISSRDDYLITVRKGLEEQFKKEGIE